MKYCVRCGREADDNAEYCPSCGNRFDAGQPQSTSSNPDDNSPAVAILAVVFGALGGWLGLVFAIIGMRTYTKGTRNYKMSKIGLILWIVWVIVAILLIVFFLIIPILLAISETPMQILI